jgi:hypothetical protein
MTRLFRIEKSAVFAPIPSASDSTAADVTTGVVQRERSASRRSIDKKEPTAAVVGTRCRSANQTV